MSPADAEPRAPAARPAPVRDVTASFAADQPDLHERAENYELQLPYQ